MKSISAAKVFWVVLFICLFQVIIVLLPVWYGYGSWDLNRTRQYGIGWRESVSNFVWYSLASGANVFLQALVYWYMYHRKRLLHFWLSVVNIFMVVGLVLFTRFMIDVNILIWGFYLTLMWIVLLGNILDRNKFF